MVVVFVVVFVVDVVVVVVVVVLRICFGVCVHYLFLSSFPSPLQFLVPLIFRFRFLTSFLLISAVRVLMVPVYSLRS